MSDLNRRMRGESTVLRVLWMLLFFVVWQLAEVALWVIALIQLVRHAITGTPCNRLREFGDSLSRYAQQIARFMTYASEEKPWPMAAWPQAQPDLLHAAPPAKPAVEPAPANDAEPKA